MYKIEKTKYGMKHTFYGILEPVELEEWYDECKRVVQSLGRQFNVVLDMRETLPMRSESEEILYEGKKLICHNGMKRGAVIMDHPEVFRQMRQIAKYANVHQKERFIDATISRDWEKLSEDWVIQGIDPDRI